MKRGAGYIAIDRGIFDHWIARNAKRFRAWQWMIADAAYAPRGKRGTWGVVHLERGQLVGSEPMLAARWRWSRSAVHRLLARLEQHGMITRLTTRTVDGRAVPVNATISGQPTEQPTVPHLEHDITVITICNYDAFNKAGAASKIGKDSQPNNRPESASAQTQMFPQFREALTTKPINQETERKGEAGGEGKRASASPPRHGIRSKHGTVFILKNSDEWRVYAEDFKSVRFADPLPNRFAGYWFYWLGEAKRPANQLGWRDRNAFGAARRLPKPIDPPAEPSAELLQTKIVKGGAG